MPFALNAIIKHEGEDIDLAQGFRERRRFWLIWLIGNAWWSVVCFTGLSAVEWVWNWLKAI